MVEKLAWGIPVTGENVPSSLPPIRHLGFDFSPFFVSNFWGWVLFFTSRSNNAAEVVTEGQASFYLCFSFPTLISYQKWKKILYP